MGKIKFKSLSGDTEGLTLAQNKSWTCGLDDKDVSLSLLIDVVDMYGATGEIEFKDYNYIFSVGIIASKPHKSFYEGEGKPTLSGLIYDCNSYMGTVPLDHKLLSTDAINKNLMGELKAKNAKIVTEKRNFGTIAAQDGPGSEFSYPQFKTSKDALNFAKLLIENYANPLMVVVGFTLDQPINMVGDNGWYIINKQVNGCK